MTEALDVTVVGVLFDMDGTLVDSTPVVEAVWAEFAHTHGLDLAEVLAYCLGRQSIDSVRHFLPHGLDVPEAAARLDAQELELNDGIVEIPGAGALLTRLAGTPSAVVTSASRKLAERRIRAAGLIPPDVLVTSEDVSEGKPSPSGYLRAARQLGVPVQDCAVFEDAEAGLRAAVASGAHVVIVGNHQSATTRGLPRIPDLTAVSVVSSNGRVRLQHP